MSQHLAFHKQSIYTSFFLNIKTVPEYPSFEELNNKNPDLAQVWLDIQKKKDSKFTYENNAQYYPEFAKIVTISFGVCNVNEDGVLEKNIKKITDDDESKIVKLFSDVLNRAYNHNNGYILVGHNLNNFHIPMFIRRFIKHNENLTIKIKKDDGNVEEQKLNLPPLIKNSIMAKPWDRKVIDTLDIWKFGGNDYVAISTIANYLGLNIDDEKNLLTKIDNDVLGMIYYNDKNLDDIGTLAANEIEILMKILIELRKI